MIRLGLDDYRPPREQRRAITLADFAELALQPETHSGVRVSAESAQEYAPFRNGVVVISSDIGKIPRRAWIKKDDGTREKQEGTYLDRLLRQPNPYINDLDLWQTVAGHSLTGGNGYLEIEWDKAFRPIALWPILPELMEPFVEGNLLWYRFRGQRRISPWDVIHIKGPSRDGLVGDDTVKLARQSLGLGMAAERYGATYYGNGAQPGLVFVHPGKFDTDQRQRFRDSWNRLHGGLDRAHGVAVTEQGMKPEKIGDDPDDAQAVETREHQVVETARILNLPPHKIKHKMGERPGANLTESEQDYLNNTLDPWLVRIEQELSRKLIPEPQRASVYIEHDRAAYLRMTPDQKATNYKAYFDMGVLSAEEIAKKENLPPPPEPEPEPEPLPALPPAPDEARMVAAQRKLAIDAAGLFIRTEAAEARRAAKKGPEGFQTWLGDFYERKADLLAGSLVPLVEFELARRGVKQDAAEVARGLARVYVERSKEELLDVKAPELEAEVERLTERWKLTRPAEMADAIGGINA